MQWLWKYSYFQNKPLKCEQSYLHSEITVVDIMLSVLKIDSVINFAVGENVDRSINNSEVIRHNKRLVIQNYKKKIIFKIWRNIWRFRITYATNMLQIIERASFSILLLKRYNRNLSISEVIVISKLAVKITKIDINGGKCNFHCLQGV